MEEEQQAGQPRDPIAAVTHRDPYPYYACLAVEKVFTFGVGPHACPGRRLATSIARAAVAQLLGSGVDPRRLDIEPSYRPSPNCRMPLLAWTGATGAMTTTAPTAMTEA
jgi:cytochrome P450